MSRDATSGGTAGFHPDLLPIARFLPSTPITPRRLALVRRLTRGLALRGTPTARGVVITDHHTEVDGGAARLRVRTYRPEDVAEPPPAVLWIHGGGFVIGAIEQDDRLCIEMVRKAGVAVASVDYRLAPDHPFPTPAEDCYAALRWWRDHSGAIGARPDRMAVAGASAGGGLAAAVALMAADRDDVDLAFQVLLYPMLDDRTVLRADAGGPTTRLWSSTSNRFGWRSYLGNEPGGDGVSDYAAPSRRADLGGVAPAWIGVGTADLFHDEDVDYARRLQDAGVECQLEIVPGAYHAFDAIQRRADVSRGFRASYLEALALALADPA